MEVLNTEYQDVLYTVKLSRDEVSMIGISLLANATHLYGFTRVEHMILGEKFGELKS